MATASSLTSSTASQSTGPPRWAIRLGAIGVGLVINVVYAIVLISVAGYDLKAPEAFGQPAQSIEIGAIVGASVVPALLGWGLLALLERLVPKRAALIWGIMAGIILVGGMPYNGAGITATNQLLLAVTHLIVGAAVIPAFVITSLRRR